MEPDFRYAPGSGLLQGKWKSLALVYDSHFRFSYEPLREAPACDSRPWAPKVSGAEGLPPPLLSSPLPKRLLLR